MKNTISSLLLFLIVISGYSQEVISPLPFNSFLYYKHYQANQEYQYSSRHEEDENLVEKFDTINLPFIDDFSTYRLKRFDFTLARCFDEQFGIVDSCHILQSKPTTETDFVSKTTWIVFYDTVMDIRDSIANKPYLVEFRRDTNDCENVDTTILFWLPTFQYSSFDTNTGLPTDSVLITADTTLKLRFDTIHYVYPDTLSLWADNHAWVNSSYPVDPPSIGVATLDGLNATGGPHSTAILAYGVADVLTSKPIALDTITSLDSVYLSFFYQPQGFGDLPQSIDSLVVEFKASGGKWEHQWSVPGDTIHGFKQVVLPVLAQRYLHGSFQFRFKNYATLSGNNDHWNVDYVRLDKNRNPSDTSFNDLAFSNLSNDLLNDYTAMPWKQFKAGNREELDTSVMFTLNNHFSLLSSVDYQTHLVKLPVDTINSTQTQNIQVASFGSEARNIEDLIISIPNYNGDSVVIRTIFYHDGIDNISSNNLVFSDQKFFNYYAYDDGSAEKAYGLFGSGSQFAMEFRLNIPDTLRAVQVHFANMNFDATLETFSIRIWDRINKNNVFNNPDSLDKIKYSQHFEKPQYVDSVNGFFTYVLDTPQALSGRFYLGWLKSSDDIMNFGLDLHNDASEHSFYFAGGQWNASQVPGAVMIRPLLGHKLPDWITGGKGILYDYTGNPTNEPSCYPNPANEIAYVQDLGDDISYFRVYDNSGKLVSMGIDKRFINTGNLLSGIYHVHFYTQNGSLASASKLVVIHP